MEEKQNRMKVARGQEKARTGSSTRSRANPSNKQALSKERLKHSRAPGYQGGVQAIHLSLSLASLFVLLIGSSSVKAVGASQAYLHRSVGCRGDGSLFYRNTCSCQCCFYIAADRGC